MKKPEIDKLYQEYRSSRSPDQGADIRNIVSMSRQKRTPSEREVAGDAKEPVTALFKTWQAQRDPRREEHIAGILAAIRRQREQRSHRPSPSAVGRLLERWRMMLDALQTKFGKLLPQPGWQIAVPALILVAVLTIVLPRPGWMGKSEHGYASNGIPTTLLTQASRLAKRVQPPPPSASFGFSDTEKPANAAFRLGIMTTDLYLLAASSRENPAADAIIERMLETLPSLGVDATGLSSANEKGNSSPNQVARAVDQLLGTHQQAAMFRLGKWVETTLLTIEAIQDHPSPDNQRLLEELSAQWRKEGKIGIPEPSPAVSRLMTRLDDMAAKPTPEGIRQYHRLLRKIKAALM